MWTIAWVMCRNEGGANSPLVVYDKVLTAVRFGSRNEGGANSPLVEAAEYQAAAFRPAAMREGRIRPSLGGGGG